MPNDWKKPHEHAEQAGAPGASAPGEAAYEGEVQIGDIGADDGPLSNAEGGLSEGEAVPERVREAWERAED